MFEPGLDPVPDLLIQLLHAAENLSFPVVQGTLLNGALALDGNFDLVALAGICLEGGPVLVDGGGHHGFGASQKLGEQIGGAHGIAFGTKPVTSGRSAISSQALWIWPSRLSTSSRGAVSFFRLANNRRSTMYS